MFEFTTWRASFLDFLISLRHYTVIGNQLFISNDRNRVLWVVLGLLQDGACTDFFENLSENTLKGDLSNAPTFNPPLFSLVDTFKINCRVNFRNGSFVTRGSQRDVIYFGWPIAPSYVSPNAGGAGVTGSQPMSTAVHRGPNNLWRFNSIFNLCS